MFTAISSLENYFDVHHWVKKTFPSGFEALFNHIVELFNIEPSTAPRRAHELTPATPLTKNIWKTPTKLTASGFLRVGA
jgi:hypothetical protein